MPRAHLRSGAGDLVRLLHPSLPELSAGRLTPDGLVLGPKVKRPSPLSLPEDQLAPFLLRVLSFCAFLKWRGLAVAASDLTRLGAHPADRATPWLGAPPVPEWCGAPPELAMAAVALRAAGAALGELEGDGDALRRAISRALRPGDSGRARRFAAAALSAHDAGRAPEALLGQLARDEGLSRLDGLLGLALPTRFQGVDEEGAPSRRLAAHGLSAAYVARGFARRYTGVTSFAELPAASPLEEGAALRKAAGLLGDDPRAARLAALADGREPRGARGGPPLVLVALSAEGWDRRSRSAWQAQLGAEDGVARVETLERGPAPWDETVTLEPWLRPSDVAELLWLPFLSPAESEPAFELVASTAAGRVERFLAAARGLAAGFDLGMRGRRRYTLAARGRARREPLLAAAALLHDGFSAAELALAGGTDEAAAGDVIERGALSGLLVRLREGHAFRDPGERADHAARVPSAARRDAVRRLEEGGLAGDRLLVAALARGTEADLSAAGARLLAAVAEGDGALAHELLRRAPQRSRDLGCPLVALRVLYERGEVEATRRLAASLSPVAFAAAPLDERLPAARILARLRDTAKALELVPRGDAIPEALARARVALEAHELDEVDAVLAPIPSRAHELTPGQEAELHLLLGERAARRCDDVAARAALRRAVRLLDQEDGAASLPALFSAGYLASDLERVDDAVRFFAAARRAARDDATRADASVDLAVVAIHAGRFAEAESELERALALFAAREDQDRYVSTLGNRADLALARGDVAAARADLSRVLAHDRAPGREHQLLFSLTTLQRLALLAGDLAAAEEVWHEIGGRRARFREHPALREALVLEGARRLVAREPESALAILEEAGALPENRHRTEPLRARLVESAAADLGRASSGLELSKDEQRLQLAERRMAKGEPPPPEALRLLEARAATGPGAAEVCGRVVEWAARFPHAAGALLALGRQSAARAGVPEAIARLEAAGAGAMGQPLRGLPRPLPEPPEPEDATEPASAPAIVADDESTRAALEAVRRFAKSRVAVLLLGESGTGKEVLAQELHRLSGRRPFVPVNVAAISPTLVESELFGHARGAFTGADRDRAGVLEAASGGTLFLDEIGDLPLALQAKLLRTLQEKTLRRVGEVRERRVDLRVVAATHRDLKAMVDAGTFRRDLFHRLAGAEVWLAPLRERPKDLRALLDRLLRGLTIEPDARLLLLSYSWPGNVRELVAAVESARVLASPATRLLVAHLPRAVRSAGEARSPAAPVRYRDVVDEARRRAIRGALAACEGNRSRAAKLLGLSRQSLLYEVKKLGIVDS